MLSPESTAISLTIFSMISKRPLLDPLAWYSQADVARALGVDRHTVARYDKAGYIKFRIHRHTGRRVAQGMQVMSFYDSTI